MADPLLRRSDLGDDIRIEEGAIVWRLPLDDALELAFALERNSAWQPDARRLHDLVEALEGKRHG